MYEYYLLNGMCQFLIEKKCFTYIILDWFSKRFVIKVMAIKILINVITGQFPYGNLCLCK